MLSLVDLNDYFTSAYQLQRTRFLCFTPDGNIGFYTMKDQPYLVVGLSHLCAEELTAVTLFYRNFARYQYCLVSQEHGLGRISFFNTDEDVLQTITGFELNAAIEP